VPGLDQRRAHGGKASKGLGNAVAFVSNQLVTAALGLPVEPSENPLMRLDHSVGKCRLPFDHAGSQDGETAFRRELAQGIRVQPLAFLAQAGHPVGRNAGENPGGQAQSAEDLEPIEQLVHRRRIRSGRSLAQPHEPADAAVHLLREQGVEAPLGRVVEAIGDAPSDPTLRFDQGFSAEPLDRRWRRYDDPPLAELCQAGGGQGVIRARLLGFIEQPVRHLLPGRAGEWTITEVLLEFRRVLVSRRRAFGVLDHRVAGEAELSGDEGQHPPGNELARLKQPARITEGAELKREADPVAWTPSSSDDRDLVLAQGVEASECRLVLWQVEQRGPLPIGQNGAPWHGADSLQIGLAIQDQSVRGLRKS
jgi:hypothetical protein